MMKRLLVAAALLGVAAPAADAQLLGSTNFGTLCGILPGEKVCVTGSAELYEGMLKVSVQNVQGPAGDLVTNGTKHRVVGFGLYYDGASMGPAGTLGGTIPGGGWNNGVSNDLRNPGPDGGSWSWLLGAMVQGNGGTFGCDDPTGNNNDVSSCAGPLVFTFTGIDASQIRMDDLGFAFRSRSIGENGESYKCYSTNGGASNTPCITTTFTATPEPGTIVLLAGGLLGLGGFGFVRRRREGQL